MSALTSEELCACKDVLCVRVGSRMFCNVCHKPIRRSVPLSSNPMVQLLRDWLKGCPNPPEWHWTFDLHVRTVNLLGNIPTADETRAVQEPAGVPVPPDLYRAASHLLSHWDAHRKCFELCGTAVSELQAAFAASAAPGHPEPPALKASEQQPNIELALLAAGAGKAYAKRNCTNLIGDFEAIEAALRPAENGTEVSK